MKKRVLFINPANKKGISRSLRIHMGLSLLGQILTNDGHEVKLIDYAYLSSSNKIKIPELEEVIENFKPEVIGLSVFTAHYDQTLAVINKISNRTEAPIIVGGPHTTLFPEDFANDTRISYIVRGEAEEIIADLVRNAKREPAPIVINCPVPSPDRIPPVNLDIAYGSGHLTEYQIQLSRGCPFNCSFCNVNIVAGRKVRARDLDLCIEQIALAKKKYPSIERVSITDDCPTFNKTRFKEFLKKFAEKNLGVILNIDNIRADLIDEEMLQLYARANGRDICLGMESGHPEVFKFVHKGESLDIIINAARLVRKYKFRLGLCFVIGLPEDTFERHLHSIKLAKELKPDYIFWNMCLPWPRTEVHSWFLANGKLGDPRNFSTLLNEELYFENPPAESPDFPREERIRAWLKANLDTYAVNFIHPTFRSSAVFKNFKRLLYFTNKYHLRKSLIYYIWKVISYKMWTHEMRATYLKK